MTTFAKYIKTLSVLMLIGAGVSACTGTRSYDPGAYAQVDRLVQVGCNDRRIGGKD